MTTTQTFKEAVAEFIARTKAQIGKESGEGRPPPAPSPYRQDGPPFESALRFDSETIRRYAGTIGDTNPLYTDPEYGRQSRYGSQIAPGCILYAVRYPAVHGARRPGGYPVANFFSGTAWEFYDVIRVGSRFKHSKITKEVVEKQGSQGQLLFLITEVMYWDSSGRLPAKCYGQLTMVPTEAMGATRTVDVEKLGEKMLYTRGSHRYSNEETEKILAMVEVQGRRRGAEPLYWEDVEVGEKLPPVVLPPWTGADHLAPGIVTAGTGAGEGGEEGGSFERAYFVNKEGGEFRVNPVTRWPWNSRGIEHDDALLAPYRGLPGPFDSGSQRTQIPQQVVTNWMGDEGFIRRQYTAMRRPVYYADACIYSAEVVKKSTVVEQAGNANGNTPGKAEYYSVGIKLEGTNQVGQTHTQGTFRVYLPSRKGGPVQLPIPHEAHPPFVPFDQFYKDWY